MTQGFDCNLQVLTTGAFEQMYRQATALNIADPLARLLLRLFLSSAVELPLAKTSIAIPDNLREFAGLKESVLVIGQGDYFEVWTPAEWKTQMDKLQDVEANEQRFSTLDLSKNVNS